MDLTDGAGNGRVRKPRIRVTKALRNLSQASVTDARYGIYANSGLRGYNEQLGTIALPRIERISRSDIGIFPQAETPAPAVYRATTGTVRS